MYSREVASDKAAALRKGGKSDEIQTMAVGLWTSLLAKPLSDKATGYAKIYAPNGRLLLTKGSPEEVAARREQRSQAQQAQQMVDAAPAAAAVLTWSGSYYWRVRFEAVTGQRAAINRKTDGEKGMAMLGLVISGIGAGIVVGAIWATVIVFQVLGT